MITSLYSHEKTKVTKAIANLKWSIMALEKITPRTAKIETELKKSKAIEKQLIEASRDPAFIKNLMEKSLKQTYAKSINYTKTQQAKRGKRRTWKGLTRPEIAKRNSEIKRAWKRTKLSESSFAKNQSKKRNLSVTQIKKIIRLSE